MATASLWPPRSWGVGPQAAKRGYHVDKASKQNQSKLASWLTVLTRKSKRVCSWKWTRGAKRSSAKSGNRMVLDKQCLTPRIRSLASQHTVASRTLSIAMDSYQKPQNKLQSSLTKRWCWTESFSSRCWTSSARSYQRNQKWINKTGTMSTRS